MASDPGAKRQTAIKENELFGKYLRLAPVPTVYWRQKQDNSPHFEVSTELLMFTNNPSY